MLSVVREYFPKSNGRKNKKRNGKPKERIYTSSINYTNNAAPTAIAPSLSIGNADSSATLTGAKVQIASGLSSNEDRLGILGQSGISGAISGTKITWSYNTNTGELTLSGNDSVDNYQSVLRQVAYSDLSNTPNTAQRTIGYSVQFGSC